MLTDLPGREAGHIYQWLETVGLFRRKRGVRLRYYGVNPLGSFMVHPMNEYPEYAQWKWLPVEINHDLIKCGAVCTRCGQLYAEHDINDVCPDDSGRRFELSLGVKDLER